MNTDQRFETSARPAVAPVRQSLHCHFFTALLIGAVAISVAALQEQEAEQPEPASPVTAAVPYVSPYPAPQVDPSAPPQEPAPTF